MITDAPNYEMLVGQPIILAVEQAKQNQLPEGGRYVFDWHAFLQSNPPTESLVGGSEHKQILSGKVAPVDLLAIEFPKLVKQWKEETFFISSSTKLFNHPAYVRIMAMGTAGIPLVLGELQKNSGRWFYALKFMAGEKGKDVAAGINNYEDAKAAWLEWGYKNNYI